MNEYLVKVKFIDGTKKYIEVKAENRDEALDKAMPIEFEIIGKDESDE